MGYLVALLAALGAPHWVSGNFPRDLYGPVDARMVGQSCNVGPCIWGHADAAVLPIQFQVPAGYRVRIVALRGDLVAWIKTLPGDPLAPAGSAAGVLGGFQTTSSLAGTAVPACLPCAAGNPLYVQAVVTERQPGARAGFNYDGIGLVLDGDNVLHAKIAVWLDTAGPVHVELTYVIGYMLERQAR